MTPSKKYKVILVAAGLLSLAACTKTANDTAGNPNDQNQRPGMLPEPQGQVPEQQPGASPSPNPGMPGNPAPDSNPAPQQGYDTSGDTNAPSGGTGTTPN